MKFRFVLVLAFLLGAMLQPASAQFGNPSKPVDLPRKVITWVPPYGIAQVQARLPALYSGAGPRTALTHLALQFWVPTSAGALARSSRYTTITNAHIQWFVNWGRNNGVDVLLCIYNGENDWDWSLTQAVINPANRNKFAAALVAEMQARGLDGIDVDLEGAAADFEADKPAYIAFIRELARQVHLKGKIITVDSFPYQWNAPNWNWWAALFPLVDGINSMGYEDLGRNASGWQGYLTQKNKAGIHSHKLQIGIPSYLPTWQSNTTLEQVQWFRTAQAQRVGVAIWDGQFPDSSWNSAPVWQQLRAINPSYR